MFYSLPLLRISLLLHTNRVVYKKSFLICHRKGWLKYRRRSRTGILVRNVFSFEIGNKLCIKSDNNKPVLLRHRIYILNPKDTVMFWTLGLNVPEDGKNTSKCYIVLDSEMSTSQSLICIRTLYSDRLKKSHLLSRRNHPIKTRIRTNLRTFIR